MQDIEITDDSLDVMDMQLHVIANIMDVDESVYDSFQEDRIKVVSNAVKIILKLQKELLQR